MMKKLSRSFTAELLFKGLMWMGLWCTLEPAKSVVIAKKCHVNVRFGSSITLQSWLPYRADNNVDLDLWDCPSVTSVDKTLLDPIFGSRLTWTLNWGKENEGHLVRLTTTWSLFGDQAGITENNSYINQFYMADHCYWKRAFSVLVQESCKTGLQTVLTKKTVINIATPCHKSSLIIAWIQALDQTLLNQSNPTERKFTLRKKSSNMSNYQVTTTNHLLLLNTIT